MSGTQATSGNWMTQTINGMNYDVLLPANYDPSVKYPVVLYLHQLDMGNDPVDLVNEVNPWFNSAAFRTDHPAIIVMPLLDQSADPSGQTINWGGVSTADSAGETNALAALKRVMGQYSTDTSRVYVTGNSMGGIGTEDILIKYNAYTGTEGKIFAAGLALAGSDYGQGYPQPDQSVVTGLQNVPFWAIHGGQDTTVPLAWDQNLYAAEQAIGGKMMYTQDDSLGHDVWDTYYPQTGSSSPLGWLFSQSLAGTGTGSGTQPQGNVHASANGTTVMAGSAAAIVDAAGNKWTITAGGQVAVNGTTDSSTANVTELAYVNGTVWQENAAKLWWGKGSPADSWSPAAGTASSPLPKPASANDTVVKAGSSAAIVDANGNSWTITPAGQVAVNGTTDSSTANVTELAYVNGTVWQENAAKLWWGKGSPTDAWSPAAGTATSPLPAAASANDTVVKAGSTAAIIDANGNSWTITPAGQVAVNGATDSSTANVTELAYVNGTVWQENTAKLWWGKNSPTESWSPAAGTATSPVPSGAASVDRTVVLKGSTASIIDGHDNTWTMTAAGQVAVNGTVDGSTANVIALAYVGGQVWQENAAKLWWGKSSPNDSWSPAVGTASNPLGDSGTLTQGQSGTTVSLSQISLALPASSKALFISGTGDIIRVSGGAQTITDTGGKNVFVLAAAGHGAETFTSNVLQLNDRLDLRPALAATDWNGTASTLASYLSVSSNGQSLVLSIAEHAGGTGSVIATIHGAAGQTLAGLLAHAIS